MIFRAAALYLVVILATLLAGYGGAYGFLNVVFFTGAACVLVLAVAEWATFRHAFAIPLAVAVMGVFFLVIDLPALSVPVCPPPPGQVACAAPGALERAGVAVAVFIIGAAAVLAMRLRRPGTDRAAER